MDHHLGILQQRIQSEAIVRRLALHQSEGRRGEVENVQPGLRQLSDDPALERQHGTWTAGRNQFNAELRRPGSQAQADKWQKLYYQGIDMEGRAIAPDHRTRLRVKPFTK